MHAKVPGTPGIYRRDCWRMQEGEKAVMLQAEVGRLQEALLTAELAASAHLSDVSGMLVLACHV